MISARFCQPGLGQPCFGGLDFRRITSAVTVIVNKTQQVLVLNMNVGNCRYSVDFATIDKGAKPTIHMDKNDTNQEFLMGVDKSGKKVSVTSEDCGAYKSLTITEVDGRFDVEREPRTHYSFTDDDAAESSEPAAPASKKRSKRRFLKSVGNP